MKIRSLNANAQVEVNVIPLLDVVFSILAFFILLSAGLTAPQRIGVDLPQVGDPRSQTATNQPQPEMLIVTLDKSGKTRIEDKTFEASGLEVEVKSFIDKYPQGLVVLNAEDPTVSYQQVINKVADLRKVAGNRVAIATSKS
jgi:biopolymer transport protein ExbD